MQAKTIEVLKSFATINQGIVISVGNEIRTMSQAKNIFGTATVPDNFTRNFAIYNLPELLSVLSLGDAPVIKYENDHMLITNGRSKIRYVYSNPAMVVSPPPGKSIPINDPKLTFNLTKEQIAGLLKAASILKSTDLEITKEYVRAVSKKGSDNSYTLDLENVEGDSVDTFVVKIDSLKLISADYLVRVTPRVIAFDSESEKISYAMTLEKE